MYCKEDASQVWFSKGLLFLELTGFGKEAINLNTYPKLNKIMDVLGNFNITTIHMLNSDNHS